MAVVVDTNVLLTASGIATHASLECKTECGQRLLRITNDQEKLVLDEERLILGEYRIQSNPTGQPNVGDAFLKWVMTNFFNPNRCELVSVEGVDFPDAENLTTFDLDDRIFVRVALAHGARPTIWNAVDTDWWIHRAALQEVGITIDFLCPTDVQALL